MLKRLSKISLTGWWLLAGLAVIVAITRLEWPWYVVWFAIAAVLGPVIGKISED